MSTFLNTAGDPRRLKVHQVAECIYAITYYFAHTYLEKGDRTIDQMIQAARSGKQNITEGGIDGATSKEMEIKLLNVARGSMHELLDDYKDYLMLRQLALWPYDSEKAQQTRRVCMMHNDPHFYQERIKTRSDETIANIAITLIHQYDVMMRGLLDKKQNDFLKDGGIREQMTRARIEYRNNQNNRS